ncbi:SGNH/GDSL hydrolase family protein [Conexibacter sp. DBS9H8]|uniref:SGNH/GDSL hydrolase family protein n=1 Tax=Conexibacter sp. DBS9H8 TaxID=2937801 RepID=UPI00200C01CC|nr:SGNH/GDSL hydrolase family protein [Conexibacter sp. DBS9H8]
METGAAAAFTFTNRTGRPSGPVLRMLSAVLPGVAAVQAQVGPYAAAWRAANLDALTRSGRRWVALGDSMTQGIGASSPFHGWVNQAAERLPVPLTIVNLSQSGARVEDVIDQQLPAWRSLPPAAQPDLITVLIGSNDVISPRHRRLLIEAFTELLEALPAGALVAELPSPVRAASTVNALLHSAARRGTIRVIRTDHLDPSVWRGRLAGDNFHPNDAGYRLIADAFTPALTAALAVAEPAAG